MKTQLKIIVSNKITELEQERFQFVMNSKFYYDNCDISDFSIFSKVNFFGLNLTKNHIRKLDKKLSNLRQLQANLKKCVIFTA